MRIKTLEVQGFKSFVDRTVVQFEEGVTGIVGPNGCGKCVHGDTLVPLSDGRMIPIRTLVDDALARAESVQQMDDGECTYDNPDDLHVLSLDCETLKMVKRPVLAFVKRTSPEKLLKVTTRSGHEIIATEYHPFFIHDAGKVRAIRADELKPGLHIASPRYLPVRPAKAYAVTTATCESCGDAGYEVVDNMLVAKSTRVKPLQVEMKLTPEWGRFLGYIISEGQNSKWTDQVRFVNADAEVIEDYCQTASALFAKRPTCKGYKGGSLDCLLFSSTLCDLLETSFDIRRGGHSSTKQVPPAIFSAPDDVVWNFLSTLIEGDGCIRVDRSNPLKPKAYVEYASASEELARGFASLLLRFGIRSLIRRKWKKATNSSGPEREYFSVYIYGTENLKLLEENLTLVSYKKDKLAEAARVHADSAATFDIIPNLNSTFGDLWNEAEATVLKEHALRGRLEVYRSNACKPSRTGMKEAVAYVRDSAKTWNDSCERLADDLERVAESDIYWDKIEFIEEIKGEEWVYDLCVERDHNFVANNVIVHNSNIVDAIRWVMGEQSAKHLRGGAMEDVIFNGAESRSPTGMSQVFMTFDNSDGRAPAEYAAYSEIQIGRRLYRSGESEYYINKTPCRLKDIVDLFLGTGVGTKAYSIVEQGKVEQIVSSKPEDRRMLIEEAAGISKFKSRKDSALRKMESTKDNLSRLDDILGELGRQLNSLNRQVKKAERYQRVADELRNREMVLAATQYRSLSSDLEELQHKTDTLKEGEAATASTLSREEADLDTARLDIAETERELDGVQQELYALQNAIKLAEATITHKKSESASLAQQNESFASEVEDLKQRIVTIDSKLSRANDEKIAADFVLVGSTGIVEEIDTVVNERRGERKQVSSEVNDDKLVVARASSSVAHERSRVEDLERRAIDVQGRIAKNQSEIDGIDGREASIKKDKEKLESGLAGARQLKLSLSEEHQSSASTLTQQRENLHQAEESVQTLRADMGVKKSQLSSLIELRDNLEGYHDGVRAVLSRSREAQDEFDGVVGTVGDLVETDSAYECAVSAVLGDRLQGIVVRSQEEGVSAIDYLKTASCGRSTFIPLDVRQVSESTDLPTGEGVVGPLSNVVRFADDYRAVGDYLMGDIVLVDTLRRALGIWNEGVSNTTIVTMDGEVIDPAGVVTGGAGGDGEERLVAQKRRIKEFEIDIASLTSELARAESELATYRDRVKNLETNVESLTKNGHDEEIRIVSQERDVARLGDELKRYDHERDRLAVEIAALTDELNDVQRDRDAATERIDGLTSEENAAKERLTMAEARLKELTTVLESEEQRLLDSRVTNAAASERETAADRELENLIAAKTEAIVTRDRRTADITTNTGRQALLKREADSLKQELDLNVRAIDGLESSRTALSEKYQTSTETVRARELELREVRKRHTEMSNEMHAAELAFTEHRGKVDHLIASIRERYRIEITSTHEEYPTPEEFDTSTEETDVAKLREKIDNIGSVNLDALQEYEDLKERFDFLNIQREDLAQSLENLSKAIARINRTSRQRFRSTFEAVDTQFQTLFPKLFRGGKARLMLTDEENILETGVEIVVQPPGKKLQSITLLSGGEKALTAVALIFSIFLIKPSPFCLLDEVDAPLDDANIDRFNELIRSMIQHSQFILITHNKRTMELADILYGVTMEEAGVSKIVSVKLGQGQAEPAVA